MPYKMVEENGGYYVVNEQTGKRKNKMPISKERAVKYMRALYAVEGGDKMRGKEIHDQVMTAFKRNFDKNTGGGVDRDKLPASDFVDPERRRFPIVTASDIMDAVHSYGRAKPAIPFEEFKRRVIAIAKRKGFVSSLPKDWNVETKEIAEKMDFVSDDQRKAVFATLADRGNSKPRKSSERKPKKSKPVKGPGGLLYSSPEAVERSIEAAKLRDESEKLEEMWRRGKTNELSKRGIHDRQSLDREKRVLISRAQDLERGALADVGTGFFEKKELSPSLMVYKDAAGQDRWVLFSSNAYQDRDKEIVSTAALEADVARADKEQNYGPLRWWHVGKPDPVNQLPGPGADLGVCDFRALHGRMLVESGTFHNSKVAAAVKEIAPLLQVSLGFFHPRTEPDATGVFHSIKTFERSILPAGRASNSLTAIPAVKILDGGDTVLKEKIQAFRALLKDDELVDSILAMAEAKEKEAQDQGVAFKGEEPAAEPVATKDETQIEAVEAADVQAAAEPVEEVEEEYEPTIGDLSPDAFAGLLAEAMDKAMEPHRKELKDLQASMKLKDDSEAALREAVESQAQTIKSLKSQLDELTGQQPRVAKQGYRDSQSEATVVKDDSRVKGKQPTVDPDFIKMFTP